MRIWAIVLVVVLCSHCSIFVVGQLQISLKGVSGDNTFQQHDNNKQLFRSSFRHELDDGNQSIVHQSLPYETRRLGTTQVYPTDITLFTKYRYIDITYLMIDITYLMSLSVIFSYCCGDGDGCLYAYRASLPPLQALGRLVVIIVLVVVMVTVEWPLLLI